MENFATVSRRGRRVNFATRNSGGRDALPPEGPSLALGCTLRREGVRPSIAPQGALAGNAAVPSEAAKWPARSTLACTCNGAGRAGASARPNSLLAARRKPDACGEEERSGERRLGAVWPRRCPLPLICRAVGLSGCRAVGLSGCRAVGHIARAVPAVGRVPGRVSGCRNPLAESVQGHAPFLTRRTQRPPPDPWATATVRRRHPMHLSALRNPAKLKVSRYTVPMRMHNPTTQPPCNGGLLHAHGHPPPQTVLSPSPKARK